MDSCWWKLCDDEIMVNTKKINIKTKIPIKFHYYKDVGGKPIQIQFKVEMGGDEQVELFKKLRIGKKHEIKPKRNSKKKKEVAN